MTTLPLGASSAPGCDDSSPCDSHPTSISVSTAPETVAAAVRRAGARGRKKQQPREDKPGNRVPALSLQGPEPAWLIDLVPDKDQRHWIRRLGVACGLDVNGTALAPTFEALGAALKADGDARAWKKLAATGKFVTSVGVHAKALTRHGDLALPPDRKFQPIAYSIVRTYPRTHKRASEARHAQIAQSILVLNAVREEGTVSSSAVEICTTMGNARRDSSRHQDRESLRALDKLAPFSPGELKKFIGKQGKSLPYVLANHLLDAQASPEEVPLPPLPGFTDPPLSRAPHAGAEPSGPDSTAVPRQPAQARAAKHTESAEAPAPSVLAAKAAAKHSGMAEQFGVRLVLNRLPPARLSRVTRGCHEALRGEDGTVANQALLLTLSVVICHGPKSTLKLAFEPAPGINIWYSREDRCVYYDRDVLRRTRPKAGRPNWGTLYVPPEAADRIETLSNGRTDVRHLADLFPPGQLACMASETQAWAKTFLEPAHGAWSSRVARSGGLAYLEAGASDLEAAIFTLNLSLASPSAPSYYAPDPARQHTLAAKVFELLGFEEPPPAPHANDQADTDVPTDEDMRKEWAQIEQALKLPLLGLSQLDVAGVLAASNKATVALRRGFELLTGARDQMREFPTFGDVLTFAQWAYQNEKHTRPRSDRLLAMTEALADLVRTTRLVRDLVCERLIELGIPQDRLALQLATPDADAMLFAFLDPVVHEDGLHIQVRRLDDGDMELLPQIWAGRENMGRRFWVREMSLHVQWMEERVTSGHGRGLVHAGSACLAIPVIDLMLGTRKAIVTALERLDLPRLGTGVTLEPRPIKIVIDLRRYERWRQTDSTAFDMPKHHCDEHTLGAWQVVTAVRPFIGKASGLSAAGRALLSLIVADGLCHWHDLQAAWPALKALARSKGPAWLKWKRPSGQPMAMPLQAPTRLAADEVADWPTFEAAEAELAKWLRTVTLPDPIQGVIWPRHPHAVVTALCAQMSRWVRLHMQPFLVEAYRPDTLAATLTWESLDQLLMPELRMPSSTPTTFAQRRRQIVHWQDKRSDLARIRSELNDVVNSTANIGQHKARVKAVLEKMPTDDAESDKVKLQRAQASAFTTDVAPRFNPFALSAAASMILHWIRLECELTYRRGTDHLDPATIYEYLTRVLAFLQRHWPQDLDATTAMPSQWRKITQQILRRLAKETDSKFDNRRIAWQRILRTLSTSPQYVAAASALEDAKARDVSRIYVPSAASTVVAQRHVTLLHDAIALAFADEPLASWQAHAMAGLLSDAGMRAAEAAVPRLDDLAADGSFIVKSGNGFDQSKTPRSPGPTNLSASTGAVLLALRSSLESLLPPHSHFIAESDGDVDRVYAMAIYEVLVTLTRSILGTDAVHGHCFRGPAAMRRLVPGWEDIVRRLAEGPFELVDALAIMRELRGSGIEHLATVLCGIGHASHQTFVRRYCTAWPIFYAATMRAQLANVELDHSLIGRMPHLKGKKIDIQRALQRRRTFVKETPEGEPRDDWAWAERHHHKEWARPPRKPRPTSAAPVEATLPKSMLVQSAPPPARDKELQYLMLRWVGIAPLPAMVKTRIGLFHGGRLERVLAALPSLSGLDHSRRSKALKPKFVKFIVGRMDAGEGQALITAISHTDPESQAVIVGQLADHADAPEVTPQGLQTLMDALPQQLAMELAMLRRHRFPTLEAALAGQQRARLRLLKKRKSRRPRVRVVPHAVGRVTQNHACALTLITRLCAIAMQHLSNRE